MRKVCSICNKERHICEFSLRKNTGKYRKDCKECESRRKKEWYEKNKGKVKKRIDNYYKENKDEILNKQKEYNKKNKEKIYVSRRKYRQENKDKISKKKSEYYQNNKQYVKEYLKKWNTENKDYVNSYYKEKYDSDTDFKLKIKLRSRTRLAIKKGQKGGSAIKDLGCSVDELKKYLESKFYPNSETDEIMSWENYGRNGWHIDHIIPLSAFDLGDREQFLKACHYTNLQPMWERENIQKSNKILVK